MKTTNDGANKQVLLRLHVKDIAIQQGRTRTWVAQHAFISYNTLIRLWTDEPIADVSIVTLLKIAAALRVDVTTLFDVIPDE